LNHHNRHRGQRHAVQTVKKERRKIKSKPKREEVDSVPKLMMTFEENNDVLEVL
jgi:hypothetical protein